MSLAGSSHASPISSHQEQRPLDDDDKQSTISHASGVTRGEHALEALRLVAGNRVRHARCAPEFLEDIATKGADGLKKIFPTQLKIIGGSEAKSFFRHYLSEHNRSRTLDDKITNEPTPSPIVFAVTVWEANVRSVDYYMTWRGDKRAPRGKDVERRIEFLDAEFRRVAKKLDDEYKRISSLRTHGNLSPLRNKFDTKPGSSPSSRKARPPGLAVSDDTDGTSVEPLIPALPEPPASAADSVMSLPLLNMIRGVPFSHRVPLRVANPDRLSLISEIDIVPVLESAERLPASKLATLEPHHTHNENHASPSPPAVSNSHRLSKHVNTDDVKKSSASIRSSDTKSSKSSRSSRSSSHLEHKGRRSSSLEKLSLKDQEVPEFVIYFLGDKLDRDTTSWHGLERQASIRSMPPDRHSPWIGPLAPADSVNFRHSFAHSVNESDSEESDGESHWRNSPVIPLKPFLESIGLAPQFYRSPPVVPGGKYISIGSVGSPMPSQSPYLYSSPRLEASPYLPAWLPPMQIPSNAPSSRPPSRAFSSASYASPYMQSHTGPF